MSTSLGHDSHAEHDESKNEDLQDHEPAVLSKEPEGTNHARKKNPRLPWTKLALPFSLQWIPQNFTWSKMKPVIRCSLVVWISLLFVIIPQTAKMLGLADFLIVIAVFISPPNGPFVFVLERSLYDLLFVTVAWAWSCLGIKLASLARIHTDPNADPRAVYAGRFLETGPTVIMSVFLFIGIVVLLYIRGRAGPGPFTFAIIFGCIVFDVTFTIAPLTPYPYYRIGQAVVVPIAISSGLSILSSAIVFPSTISSLFIERSRNILLPLISVLSEHRTLLKTSTNDTEFSAVKINSLVSSAEAALVPVAMTLHLLKRDIVWSHVSPAEFTKLHEWARKLVVRADGMSVYFALIDPTREKYPLTPAPSYPATPVATTPHPSRPPSPDRPDSGDKADSDPGHASQSFAPVSADVEYEQAEMDPDSPHGSVRFARRRPVAHIGHPHSKTHHSHEHSVHNHRQHRQHHRHHLSHGSLLHLALSSPTAPQSAVGVFESHRYADYETRRRAQAAPQDYTERFHALLGDSCDELLDICKEGLDTVSLWFGVVLGRQRFDFWRNKCEREKCQREKIDASEKVKQKLDETLERFKKEKRHLVIDPYRFGLDQSYAGSYVGDDLPPHRHLFHCYMYQFHLMEFSIQLSQLLGEIIRLEKQSAKSRLWIPVIPLRKLFSWSSWAVTDSMEKDDDEDPDVIPGMEPEWMTDLGAVSKRDPDALPPRTTFELVMNVLFRACAGIFQGNFLFALKAGVMTVVLILPSVLKSSAQYAFENKFVWGVIMAQLTLVRFRGDTTFGLVSRTISTFFGCFIGAVLWYMSTGSGHGNSYGLAVVCAVFFPFLIFGRLYWPGPPVTNIIFCVTAALVVGYGWLNTHPVTGVSSFPHWGLNLAIRRFVLVTAGVAAAFIFSLLPPSTTLRRYQRISLATTSGEMGAIYCSIVSFANTRKHNNDEVHEIVQSLIAIRSKLKRSLVLRANIVYEFSLRGPWPAQRYQKVLEVQMQIARLLTHLMVVVVKLEPVWSQAFLRRSRFLDADFQGEVLAVISLISTALRTGNPLPQITPCPLLERFSKYNHGLNIVRQEADGPYGLPKTMTTDTLENEQYLYFCVGVTTANGIIHRLDRLMVATKELVGEQYHIRGIGLRKRGGEDAGSQTIQLEGSSDVRPMKDA